MKTYDDFEVVVQAHTETPLLSVVVAIYNMEANGFLEECLRSFEEQTFYDVEYVLIDDASSDGSLAVAEKWARQRNDSWVLHLFQNSRQGAARNRGISVSRGQYIVQVDADDMIASDFLERIAKTACENDADVIAPGVIQRIGRCGEPIERAVDNIPDRRVLGKIDDTKRALIILEHWMFGCNRRDLFENELNLYPENMRYEDTPTAIRWYFCYKSIACAEGAVYYYRLNPSSTTMTTGQDTLLLAERGRSCDMILENAIELGVYERFKDELNEYYIRVMLVNTMHMLERNSRSMVYNIQKRVRERVPDYYSNPYYKCLRGKKRIKVWLYYGHPFLSTVVLAVRDLINLFSRDSKTRGGRNVG